MNFFRRGMIFFTFFDSCLAIALLIAALGTKFWVVSGAKRINNPAESDGKINFGLFGGKKELNVGYGWRSYEMDILHELQVNPEFLSYGLWAATVSCLVGSLVFSTVSAIFAVINTATSPEGSICGVVGLYLWNIFAVCFNVAAVALWTVQFYEKLQYNIMGLDDRDNMWSSANMTSLGYSFWFVVGALFVHILNIIVIYIGTKELRHEKVQHPIIEEKTNGAIMLY